LPFYRIREAENFIALFRSEEKDRWNTLSEHVRFKFKYNGHIIGTTIIELEIFRKIFVFSGEITIHKIVD